MNQTRSEKFATYLNDQLGDSGINVMTYLSIMFSLTILVIITIVCSVFSQLKNIKQVDSILVQLPFDR